LFRNISNVCNNWYYRVFVCAEKCAKYDSTFSVTSRGQGLKKCCKPLGQTNVGFLYSCCFLPLWIWILFFPFLDFKIQWTSEYHTSLVFRSWESVLKSNVLVFRYVPYEIRTKKSRFRMVRPFEIRSAFQMVELV
jgi:hypothetical protein